MISYQTANKKPKIMSTLWNHLYPAQKSSPTATPRTTTTTASSRILARTILFYHRRAGTVPVLLLTSFVLASTMYNLWFVNHPFFRSGRCVEGVVVPPAGGVRAPIPPPVVISSSYGRIQNVSAIVMNHARPDVLQRSTLLRTLASHPRIAQVLVLHSQPQTGFNNTALLLLWNDDHHHHRQPRAEDDDVKWLNKLVHMDVQDQDQELGLALRFHFCAESTAEDTDLVLLVDDDMELNGTAITQLIVEMETNPHRIVGHYGRTFDDWDALWGHKRRNGYDTVTVYGHVEVVLTKIMMLERRICREFGQFRDIVTDMVQQSTPKWNGEDIFVNLIANRVYGVALRGPYRNYAVPDLPVWEADVAHLMMNSTTTTSYAASISGNMDRITQRQVGRDVWRENKRKANTHVQFRGRLWQTAKRRLSKIPICAK
jgi:Glycosyl transferase family 64 domain